MEMSEFLFVLEVQPQERAAAVLEQRAAQAARRAGWLAWQSVRAGAECKQVEWLEK